MKLLSLLPLLPALTTANLYNTTQHNHTCALLPSPSPRSCTPAATPNTTDPCCAETHGGLLLLTQFWNTHTALESNNQLLPPHSWGLHGLWPDFCDGTYTQYCDLARNFDPHPSPNTTDGEPDGVPVPAYVGPRITPWRSAGRDDLEAWMERFFVARGEPNWNLWMHEYSKHATCMSAFDTPCYGLQYLWLEDVVEYFETAALYFNRLPTFEWLAEAGITPSNETGYSLGAMEEVLGERFGGRPFLGCEGERFNETAAGEGSDDGGRTVLNEAWYFFYVNGRPQEGRWEPRGPTGDSTCATTEGAVRYLQRTPGSVRQD